MDQLSKTVSRGDGPDQRMQLLGRHLLSSLHMLMKTVKLHEPTNVIFQSPLEIFKGVINEVIDLEGVCAIEGVGTTIYLNDHLMRIEASALEMVQFVIHDLQLHGLNGFKAENKVTAEELRGLIALFAGEKQARPTEEALEFLGSLKIIGFQELREALKEEGRGDLHGGRMARRKFALMAYSRTVYFLKKYMQYLRGEGAPVQAARAERLLQNLIDVCFKVRSTFLTLTTIKDQDDYTCYHSVNTALLNALMGVELGMSKEQILELAIAGLYHDLGRVIVPPKVLLKAGKLTPYERLEVEKIPVNTIKMMMRQRVLTKQILERLIAIYEHMEDFDKSLQNPAEFNAQATDQQQSGLSLFGRILNITHTFESLTSPRPWRNGLTPSEALSVMFTDMKGKFDPVLLRVFVKALTAKDEPDEPQESAAS
jgi:HD-GYP domain-containing protein (c-di-GMP phosphodiesterase class II)